MQNFSFSAAWKGDVALKIVFWVCFFAPAVLFVILYIPLFLLIASSVNNFGAVPIQIVFAKLPWYIWSFVSLTNTTIKSCKKGWGIAALLTAIIYCFFDFTMSMDLRDGLGAF